MDTTVADALIGALIDRRYRIRARVASGGMATVYTAVDERLERTVALKIIHPAHARDPSFLERFIEEAKTIARLTHPNVVAVYDQGTHGGLPYQVMEYVRGRTLRDVLAERRRLSPPEALAILEQMLAAIGAAHRAGLVHRDVKPENVLVSEAPTANINSLVDGVVKVADFGLARAIEASADDSGGAQLMATVAYVAPELVTEGYADPRADVYSAGIVLFEMLTGRVPYTGERPVEVAWQHVDRDVPPPSRYTPGLPRVVDDLVLRATQRDPAARPTDAGAMFAMVQAARDDVGVSVTSPARAAAPPTVAVPHVPSSRPPWARLPTAARGQLRRRGGTGLSATGLPATGLRRWWDDLVGRINAHPHGRTAVAAALLAFGLLVAVGGWWFGIGRYTDAPDLRNRTRVQAEAQARQGGFTVRIGPGQYSEKVPKDTVLDQRPGAGQRIVSGGEITLILSLGPERYPVPEIVGVVWELAKQQLEQLRLVPVQAPDVYSDTIPKGSVAETVPPPGTPVPPGAQVTVKLSKGRAPITVPNVVGKDVNEARDILQKAGLVVAVTNQDSDKPKDQVIAQNPVDGTGVEKRTTVTITISNGPAAVPLPDERGKDLDEAARDLEALGFHVEKRGSGTVRFQDPGPNTPLPPGSVVTLYAFF
jgi:serine/threonine-protein kinase